MNDIATKDIDKFLLEKLKKTLSINYAKERMILDDEQMTQIYKCIEARKSLIFSLFDESFSEKEHEIKQRACCIRTRVRQKPFANKIADNVIDHRIERVVKEILQDENLDPWKKIVISERKDFIHFLLNGNIIEENQANLDNQER